MKYKIPSDCRVKPPVRDGRWPLGAQLDMISCVVETPWAPHKYRGGETSRFTEGKPYSKAAWYKFRGGETSRFTTGSPHKFRGGETSRFTVGTSGAAERQFKGLSDESLAADSKRPCRRYGTVSANYSADGGCFRGQLSRKTTAPAGCGKTTATGNRHLMSLQATPISDEEQRYAASANRPTGREAAPNQDENVFSDLQTVGVFPGNGQVVDPATRTTSWSTVVTTKRVYNSRLGSRAFTISEASCAKPVITALRGRQMANRQMTFFVSPYPLTVTPKNP